MNGISSSCSVSARLVSLDKFSQKAGIDDGSMNQKERQKVVDKIKTDKDTRIILMSFKAGGVGKSESSGCRSAKAQHNGRFELDRV